MNIQDLKKYIPRNRVSDLESGEWILTENLTNIKFCIIYGDRRGDLYLKKANSSKELEEKLEKHLKGDTNADFDTSIYLIINNNEKADFSTKLY